MHRECPEVAKKLWLWWNVAYQLIKQISSDQKFWYYEIIFRLTTPMLSLKVSFMRAKYLANLYIFVIASFIADYADDAVYCIESAMFLSSEKYMSFVSFDSRDKRIAITINENQKTK